MSRLSETALLEQMTSVLAKLEGPVKFVVMGIGNELRGDDAAGVLVARTLAALAAGRPRLLVIDAGSAPEGFVGVLRRFSPDLVLLVDAVQLQAEPGSLHWIDRQQITGISAFTHALPLHVFANYLVRELDCEVQLLGIQPGQTAVGHTLSAAVQTGVNSAVQLLALLTKP